VDSRVSCVFSPAAHGDDRSFNSPEDRRHCLLIARGLFAPRPAADDSPRRTPDGRLDPKSGVAVGARNCFPPNSLAAPRRHVVQHLVVTERERERQSETEAERLKDRETETKRRTHRDRETERQNQSETDRTERNGGVPVGSAAAHHGLLDREQDERRGSA
jgi:hypothetical protein